VGFHTAACGGSAPPHDTGPTRPVRSCGSSSRSAADALSRSSRSSRRSVRRSSAQQPGSALTAVATSAFRCSPCGTARSSTCKGAPRAGKRNALRVTTNNACGHRAERTPYLPRRDLTSRGGATRFLLTYRCANAVRAGVWLVLLSRRPATPSLPRNRVGMESVVQLRHLQGFFARRGPEFAENQGRVRPSSPVPATNEREKPRICRSFSEPSDGLEPSTPSLPWRCSTS
jgi:hypothetical protein